MDDGEVGKWGGNVVNASIVPGHAIHPSSTRYFNKTFAKSSFFMSNMVAVAGNSSFAPKTLGHELVKTYSLLMIRIISKYLLFLQMHLIYNQLLSESPPLMHRYHHQF